MAGTNPFAGKANSTNQLELEIANANFTDIPDYADDEIVIQESHALSAWQRVLGIVFGEGVASLPVPTIHDKPMGKRRMRRLRGKAKAARAA